MSYEGYDLWLCENGHITAYDCRHFDDLADDASSTWQCPHCQGKLKSSHGVDETNGLPYQVNFSVKEIQPAKTETCDHCKVTRLLEQPRYEIEVHKDYYMWAGGTRYPTKENEVVDDEPLPEIFL